ncbi:penicillin acylase family protein, partial [Alcanivorax sp. HI0044]|uniref:penicillin acylase family protein n=1 Tax=Alcanivorax sp. HI0044 TaxID=1822234 RepID=UPI0018D49E33
MKLDAKQVLTSEGIGSNGWALGAERSESANSLLLANPHFPWDGELRFFQNHLTIPGELDITGATLVGLPAVVIGFNEHLGWTHTVSQSKRFTLYQLELDGSDPTRYLFDGESRAMTQREVTVQVKQPDGSLAPYSQPVYYSHFGPMVNLASLSPSLGWSSGSAVTFRDANAGNTRMLDQWLAMDKATSREEFFAAFEEHQGIPWVNTLMIDKSGSASYIDGTQVPQLSAQAEGYWRAASQSPQLAPIWQDGAGSVLLPGNSSVYEWVDSGDTLTPGLVPFSKAPQMTR